MQRFTAQHHCATRLAAPAARARLLYTALILAPALLTACSDGLSAPLLAVPPAPPVIASVADRKPMGNALTVLYSERNADSVRALFESVDGTDVGATPWVPAARDSLVVLGLRPATQYTITLQSERAGDIVHGAVIPQTTAPLPSGLQQVSMRVLAGSPPSGGYTLTNVNAADGHGYAVAFDSAGVIRWYHDVGATAVAETKQQRNGDITMYVGETRGSDPFPGAYVEVTPAGDSIRSIAAVGSPYTDQHELVTTYDGGGRRVADYLFGYDIHAVDRTSVGGGPSDPVAGHQILRISARGAVDTLVQGWSLWRPSDYVDPFTGGDIDHPNSLDFDRDGGIIVSFRDIDAIVKVDSATHDILWQMGGARNEFTFTNDPESGFGGQHDVRVLPNGHLLLFDNGTTHSPQASRAVEYAVNPLTRTATMVWEYAPQPAIFNTFTGSAQRLANGNTVVAFTMTGVIDEVSPQGAMVSRVQVTTAPGSPAAIYRATRIQNLYRYETP